MSTNLTRIFIMVVLALSLGACTSSESESENKEGNADLEAVETDTGEVLAEGDMPAGEPMADMGNDAGTPDDITAMKSDEAIDAPLPDQTMEGGDSIVESPAVAPPDSGTADTAGTTETPSESLPSGGNEDLFGGGGSGTEVAEAPKPIAPLRKIDSAPSQKGRILANTVYLARDGDDLDSVSQKTGASKKELRKANSFLSRGVRVGDKIYYNSKNRPEDAERMLTYYEDNNVPPQIYTAKADENIRDIAQNLLGNRDSWKELWTTNLDVESKGALPEGTQLRYWPLSADPGAQQTIASNELPPPPAPETAMPDAPPPMPPPAAASTIEPPPPPPPSEPPPPEPPKPAKMAKKSEGGFVIPGLDQDTTFTVVGAAILIAGLGAITIVRRSRARKLSGNTQTQI